ncbi:ATP-dependent DNA helicase [Corynebacterium sp. H113]|uniref:ATP-dependent DNA helicase n=1 Tax=Corynebacterium sp. H113 TaxID=3133419 RepID=UPI0030B04482
MPEIPEFDASLADIPSMPRVVFADRRRGEARQWSGPVGMLFPGDERQVELKVPGTPWRVLGGPGTGKSALLADLAVAHMAAGVSPDSIAVIAPAKDAAARIREDIAVQLALLQGDVVEKQEISAGSGGMVRAVHSLAFAIVRQAAVAAGAEEPSLTTGAKQDAVVRKLLSGHAEDGGSYWPERLVPALSMQGMARQLRDVMLRAAERGVDGPQLQAIGSKCGVPEWTAAGKFMVEYRQAMRLAGQDSLNAAELVGAALAAIAADPAIVPGLGFKVLLIDDAHHVDPQSAKLLSHFIPYADTIVVTGDHDQSVLHFRGANSDFLDSVTDDAHTIIVQTSFRTTPEVAAAASRVASRLPGKHPQRGIRTIDDVAQPESARVFVQDTAMGERNVIANFLRRQHIEHGVPWKDMVVLVRSGASESALHRHLARAGVPVAMDPTDIVLREQRMVASLMLLLRAVAPAQSGATALSVAEWEHVLTGPLCNADPVTMSRVVRAVRRVSMSSPELSLDGQQAMDKICSILASPQRSTADEALIDALPPREKQVLTVPLEILDAGRRALADGVESVLWALWDASRMHNHLVSASLRGGATGSAADRDLDAVMTLFDFAGDLAEQDPSLSISSLVRAVLDQELPTGARDRRSAPRDAVSVLSAHAALGRQWECVVVAGVQEDEWPSLGQTGSVMLQEQLIDYLDRGIMPGQPVSHVAERMAEERRLFYVALTRARRKLLITAVDAPDDIGEPSRFLAETGLTIERGGDDEAGTSESAENNDGETVVGRDLGTRVLSLHALVSELRAVVTDPRQTVTRRRHAAHQLARLADDGVAAAHPTTWWGLQGPSTDGQIRSGGSADRPTQRISPSKVGSALDCPLKAMLEPPTTSTAMLMGTAFHAIAEALERGVDIVDAEEALRNLIPRLIEEPQWRLDRLTDEWVEALHSWHNWAQLNTASGIEVPVRVAVSDDVDIVGRIDRLMRTEDGKDIVVDIKTGSAVPTGKDTEDNAQLAVYQLALALRAQDSNCVGGAQLVFPRKQTASGAPTTREQSAQTPEMLEKWRSTVLEVAAQVRGPHSLATPGTQCRVCAVKQSCPAKEGAR